MRHYPAGLLSAALQGMDTSDGRHTDKKDDGTTRNEYVSDGWDTP